MFLRFLPVAGPGAIVKSLFFSISSTLNMVFIYYTIINNRIFYETIIRENLVPENFIPIMEHLKQKYLFQLFDVSCRYSISINSWTSVE